MDIQSGSLFTFLTGVESGKIALYLVMMILLIILSAFFSMSETAFSACSDTKLRLAIEDKKHGAKKGYVFNRKIR